MCLDGRTVQWTVRRSKQKSDFPADGPGNYATYSRQSSVFLRNIRYEIYCFGLILLAMCFYIYYRFMSITKEFLVYLLTNHPEAFRDWRNCRIFTNKTEQFECKSFAWMLFLL